MRTYVFIICLQINREITLKVFYAIHSQKKKKKKDNEHYLIVHIRQQLLYKIFISFLPPGFYKSLKLKLLWQNNHFCLHLSFTLDRIFPQTLSNLISIQPAQTLLHFNLYSAGRCSLHRSILHFVELHGSLLSYSAFILGKK